MRHGYSIKPDGRVYWYADSYDSMMFESHRPSIADVLLNAVSFRARATGWYRLILPRSREDTACQRIKEFLEVQGKKVSIFPSHWLEASGRCWVYSDVFGSLTFTVDGTTNTDGTNAVLLDAKPGRTSSTGIYRWFMPKSRGDAAYRRIKEYVESLGERVVVG